MSLITYDYDEPGNTVIEKTTTDQIVDEYLGCVSKVRKQRKAHHVQLNEVCTKFLEILSKRISRTCFVGSKVKLSECACFFCKC